MNTEDSSYVSLLFWTPERISAKLLIESKGIYPFDCD